MSVLYGPVCTNRFNTFLNGIVIDMFDVRPVKRLWVEENTEHMKDFSLLNIPTFLIFHVFFNLRAVLGLRFVRLVAAGMMLVLGISA